MIDAFQLFLDKTLLAMSQASLDFGFFCDVNQNLKNLRFPRFLAFTS